MFKRLKIQLIDAARSSENMINIQFVLVPLVKVRIHYHLGGGLKRPENKVCWLSRFQRGGG